MISHLDMIKRWRLPASIVVVAIAGCTARQSGAAADWSARARATAQDRLAHAANRPCPRARRVAEPFAAPFYRLAAAAPADNTAASPAAASVTTTSPTPTTAPAAAPPIDWDEQPDFLRTATHDFKRLPAAVWDDTKTVFTNTGNLIFLLGAGGVSAGMRCELDDDVEDYYDDHHSMTEDWRDAFGAMGNPGTHFAAAGVWYLLGYQAQDDKTFEVGKQMFRALSVTGLSTMFLKVAANTDSPNGERLAWPSGHVSSTMTMATVLNNAYGPWVGVPMFALTGLVGLERLDSGEHHLSDLVFGAALGWVVAETITKEHRPEILGGVLTPYISPTTGNAGIAWVKTFD